MAGFRAVSGFTRLSSTAMAAHCSNRKQKGCVVMTDRKSKFVRIIGLPLLGGTALLAATLSDAQITSQPNPNGTVRMISDSQYQQMLADGQVGEVDRDPHGCFFG
jgi:hypothetical protein